MPARPLRALSALVALWIVGRGLAIWGWADVPQIEPSYAIASVTSRPTTARARISLTRRFADMDSDPRDSAARVFAPRRGGAAWGRLLRASAPLRENIPIPAAPGALLSKPLQFDQVVRAIFRDAAPAPSSQSMSPRPLVIDGPSEWRASAWLAMRDGAGGGLGNGGQLGGSQAGLRIYRALTPALALTVRGSAALSSPGTEASAGIALRKGPITLLAERRIAIDRGGRNAWSLTAAGGFSDVALPLDVRLDGYAQAGLVDRDTFADGAVRVERTITASHDARLSVGAGAWGGIQPGVARLDIGPQIVARAALVGRPTRLSLEWRQRIAGNASPGSGPVVTLGTDF